MNMKMLFCAAMASVMPLFAAESTEKSYPVTVKVQCSSPEEEKKAENGDVTGAALPSPSKIKEFLDQYVIGQDLAKKVLSVAVYNHYKRINNKNIADKISEIEVEMKKRNPTPMEKLSNRAANSYPFNVSPKEYWDDKEKNSNYSADDDNNGREQEQYTITVGDINNANDWKTISDSLDDDLLYNQTLNNILKY